ncbi:hypothetical protein [Bacillus sp. FJAT-45037]|uniref:hypothetical protein n=1 Tax=Bacillus sp. FJAT-45037 TaxID=2011007 RepID=UPI000C247039|nr:hypothetical protein [Bacillus sp. FJAT-45037]
MVNFDKINRQLLTNACLTCQDPHFQRPTDKMPHVGCCSYSPIFSLFELHKIVMKDSSFFFHLLNDENSHLNAYDIRVNAWIHPEYTTYQDRSLSKMEKEDVKISYSICRFFEEGTGCTLSPTFKNATCRSFICTTVEDSLDQSHKNQFFSWVKTIQTEAYSFHKEHREHLENRKIDLIHNPQAVFDYLKSIEVY